MAVFGYYSYENLILSSAWELLSLRSIDDYAMQSAIRYMQLVLLKGDLKSFFDFNGFAYGNAFWIANSILFLPLYYLDIPQISIVIQREVSLIFVFLSALVVGLIAEQVKPDGKHLKIAVIFGAITMPMVDCIGTKFHVNSQSIFLGLLAIYFVNKCELNKSRGYLISALFFGLSVGFKLTGVFILPLLVLILLNKNRNKLNIKYLITLMKYLCCSAAVVVICYYL